MKAEPSAVTDAERSATLERALAEAIEERNRLWAQLNEQRADERELEYLRSELAMIRASNMWKAAGHYQRVKRLVLIGLHRLRRG